ncbi:MAG: DNA translocase FtsK 4TM domain-containing protein, partial [Sphingomonas bacterium]|nr:DNA translocase FtsK 4TM domain-containing protein [Sphingomonas bacterium]
MATAAERARKRDLGPDWREKLRTSLRVLAMRTIGVVLVGASIAEALALATHDSVDPSFSTAAGGPPVNWLGSVGAYSSDLLLMLFGLAAVLLLPVVALAGLRLMRAEPAGRLGRSMLIAILGMLLVGAALGLMRGSAVSGLPAGWGGALGLAGAHGVDNGIALIGNPAIEGPLHLTILALLALGGLALCWIALGL